MKKYVVFVLLALLWAVDEAFAEPLRVLLPIGFSAAFLCAALLPGKWPGRIAAGAIAAGLCVFRPAASVRLLPPLLLSMARVPAGQARVRNKKTKSGADGVYTAALFAGLIAAGTFLYDISFFTRNRSPFTPAPFVWALAGVLIVYAALAVFCVKNRAVYGVPSTAVYTCALVCIVFGAVGYLLNSFNYSVCPAVFPWLCMLAAGDENDPVLQAAAGSLMNALRR